MSFKNQIEKEMNFVERETEVALGGLGRHRVVFRP